MNSPRPRRWRRRLLYLALAAIVARIGLHLALPWLVDIGAGAIGCRASYRTASLSLLGLSLRFQDLVVVDAAASSGTPLLRASDLSADVSTWELLHGRFVVVDAAVSGCAVQLERGADGAFRLPAGLRASATTAAPSPPEPAPTGSSEPTSFALPFQVVAASVHGLSVRLLDATASPARAFDCVFDLDATDLGHLERPGHLTLRAHSPGPLDHLRVHAEATAQRDHLNLQWQVTVRGLQLASLPLDAATQAIFDGARTASLDCSGSFDAARNAGNADALAIAGGIRGSLHLDAVERLALRASAGPASLGGGHGALPFDLDISSPDLGGNLRLTDGRIEQAAGHTAATASLTCRALTLRRFAPALREHGLSLADGGVDLVAGLHLELGAEGALSAQLRDLVLQHGDERFQLANLAVDDFVASAAGLEVGALRIDGPVTELRRQADGALELAGLRFVPRPATPPTPAEPREPAPSTPPPGARTFRLHQLAWDGVDLRFVDGALPDRPTVQIAALSVQAEELGFGGDLPPGHATATLRLPGSVESLRAELQARPRRDGAAIDLQVAADGLSLRSLAPWLAPLGVQPHWQNARLAAAATAALTRADAGTTLTARLADVRLTDGADTLLSLRNVELAGLHQRADGLDVGPLRIDEPFVAIVQDRDGARRIAGVAFGAAPAGAPTRPAVPAPQPARTGPVQFGPITLQGAEFAFTDHRGTPHTTSLGVDAKLDWPRGDGVVAPFTATLRVPGAVDDMTLRGDLVPIAGGIRADIEVAGRGIRGAGFAPLLPANLRVTTTDGSLQAKAMLDLRPVETGTSLDVVVRGLAWRDGETELAALDELELQVPTFGGDFVHVRRLNARGLRAVAARTDEGLHVPGLLLLPGPATAPPAAASAAAAPRQPSAVPQLRLDEFDVALERLTFLDRLGGDGVPIEGVAHLRLLEPWTAARDRVPAAPARFELRASALPLCRQITAGIQLQPFELAPWAEIDVRAEGIDPGTIPRLSPTLAARISGTTTDATLTAKLRASFELRRRDPTRFDFGKPFGGHLLAESILLQDVANGHPLLSIGSIDLRLRAIDPLTGDVLVKTVDIDSPVLHATLCPQGLDIAGVRLLAPATTAVPAPIPAPVPQGPQQGPEFAIDRLRLQGLAIDFRDNTTNPATHLPVQDLAFELHRFSTRAFVEPRPFGFSLSARGGDVELERRVLRSSLVMGLVGSTAEALALRKDQHERQARPLFADLDVSGELQVYPLPKGQFRTSLTGFELPALRGIGARGSVQINDGLCDASLVADMRAGEGTFVKSGVTFTWLSVSEPPNGPISTYLRLPAPLDTVLFVLRNDADEQRLPLQAHLPATGIKPSAIAEAAIEALALAIGDAIARSPFRIAGAVTGLFGLGEQRNDLAGRAVSLDCQPGGGAPDLQNLEALLATTANDPEVKFVLTHDLGAADLQRASDLANPPPLVRRAAVERLRERRIELLAQRAGLATEAAARYAASRHDAPVALAALAAVDQELGDLEATLDEALERLDDDTGPAQTRNARRAAENLAAVRLEAVRAALAARLPGGGVDRIEVRTPRSVPAHDAPGGGRVVVTPRRRAPEPEQRR